MSVVYLYSRHGGMSMSPLKKCVRHTPASFKVCLLAAAKTVQKYNKKLN